jgi:hypothetical protein
MAKAPVNAAIFNMMISSWLVMLNQPRAVTSVPATFETRLFATLQQLSAMRNVAGDDLRLLPRKIRT